MCTREELEREEGMTRIFRTLPSHVGVHTNPYTVSKWNDIPAMCK